MLGHVSHTATGLSPRQRVELACARHGTSAVADACVRLLAGDDIDPVMREVFGDQHSPHWLESDVNRYWLRVWGARGLLWNWDPRAVVSLRTALGDEAWRGREMAGQVVAPHLLRQLQPHAGHPLPHPVPRGGAAAPRALAHLPADGLGSRPG